MSRTRERYARFYFSCAETRQEDWRWFDTEWPQIQRAWTWVHQESGDAVLVLAYARIFYLLLDRRGLWREAVAWSEQGLQAARALRDQRSESAMLDCLGSACRRGRPEAG